MFVKSNLDYENRLRGHMYEFDDERIRALENMQNIQAAQRSNESL